MGKDHGPQCGAHSRQHVALFTSALEGGGIQRSTRNLAGALAEAAFKVDLIVCHARSASPEALVPQGVRLIVLSPAPPGWGRVCALRAAPRNFGALLLPVLLPVKTAKKLRYLPALAAYLRRERPRALVAAMTYCNLVAVWACRLAGTPTRVVVSERNILSQFVHKLRRKWRWHFLPRLVGCTYRQADAVTAVSAAVADDLAATAGLARSFVYAVPNPVVDSALHRQAAEPLDHPWFAPGSPPVVLGVTRLVQQKDPETLLRAFARLRAVRPIRLMLLGEGSERRRLKRLAAELNVAEDVAMPGWVDNPFPYMVRAGVLVLPSLYEGLPGVLIQAMACGCPVVATDCPGGSAEILGYGDYGRLVPIGDANAMADAIAATLDAPGDTARLKKRAADYSSARSARSYAAFFEGVAGGAAPPQSA